jgi:hypothetical protein
LSLTTSALTIKYSYSVQYVLRTNKSRAVKAARGRGLRPHTPTPSPVGAVSSGWPWLEPWSPDWHSTGGGTPDPHSPGFPLEPVSTHGWVTRAAEKFAHDDGVFSLIPDSRLVPGRFPASVMDRLDHPSLMTVLCVTTTGIRHSAGRVGWTCVDFGGHV